jgi:drug/metabolite transporter (DMT)-like permease
MRGSAPLLTAAGAAVFLHERLNLPALAGLAIASLSVAFFVSPGQRTTTEGQAAIGWALATGACIALYNVIDAAGVRSAESPWTFIVWLFLLDWIGVTAISLLTRGAAYIRSLRAVLRQGFAAGFLSLASFSLALYGFSIADVAYISATRETAVVFASIMAWFFLKEGFGVRRTLLSVCLCLGLALMQMSQMS